MYKLTIHRSKLLIASGLLAAAVAVTISVLLLARSASSSVRLASLDPRTLQEIGLTISPTASHSTISKASAEAHASTDMSARGVRESILANCHFGDALPTPQPDAVSPGGGRVDTSVTYDGPCWIVSLATAGHYSNGPPGSPRIAATYVLALINPQSGDLIRGFEGSGP